MTTVNVIQQEDYTRYLVIKQEKDPSTLITTRILITDNANNSIKLVDISRGPEGTQGPVGPQGPPGQNAVSFELLPIVSGGTNNTVFTNDKIIYYDGSKLSSTNYSINDLISAQNAITGIIPNTGLSKVTSGSTVTLNTNLGDGLTVDNNNNIVVDDSIARRVELTVGNISGILGIPKGGTNNSSFNSNRLIYFDGTRLSSFPLDTGRIVTSGSTINIIAGSGLIGGGSLALPSGSVVINIGSSEDVFVAENTIQLSSTGNAGTYTKVTTDIKGRVVSGTSLTQQDILDILGFTPWHAGNDGINSGLDADLLDGQDSSYYLNFSNFTGTVSNDILPNITSPGTYSKVTVSNKGIVVNGDNIQYSDVVAGLGYRPVSTNGDTINGNIQIIGNVNISDGDLTIKDNLPIFAYSNDSLLPSDPRGFSFVYGSIFKQTGIFAYFPADDRLKLITDISGSGENLIIEGDESIILFENIADQKYVSLSVNQVISGLKTFIDPVNIYNYLNVTQGVGYTGPPIIVGDNSTLVSSFNSDLLDGNHGSFYRNASNQSGTLDFNNVIVSNISGSVDYLPRFDNRTSNPSRTVSNSIVKQSGSSTIVIENGSLAVGSNNATNGGRSAAIGSTNITQANNSLAVGENNTTQANNSVAINNGSKTLASNSLAMGSYGTTWTQNQISIGAFQEINPNDGSRIGLGQQSLFSIGYNGETGGIYQSLSPFITIPNNKTVLYNIDLLFTKLGSSGVAAFNFASGIIKNINGSCFVVKNHEKSELFNDSQIRDYTYTISLNQTNNETQRLSVTKQPLINNNLEIQNLADTIRLKPVLSEISGVFNKTFDGDIVLKMNKPIFSGWFSQTEDSNIIRIKSYNHGVATGSLCNISYTSGNIIKPISSAHSVINIYNKDEFGISDYFWSGYYNNGYIDILSSSISGIDSNNKFIFTGTLSNSSNIISNCSPSLPGNLSSGMPLFVGVGGFSGIPKVSYISGTNVVLDIPYTGNYAPNQTIEFNNYSLFRFNISKSIYLSSSLYNLALDKIGDAETTTSGIRVFVSGFTGPSVLSPIAVSPTINNSGNLVCIHKRNYDGQYTRSQAYFTPYSAKYIQFASVSGVSAIHLNTSSFISSFANDYNPYIKFLTATSSFSGVLTSGSNIITNCTPSQEGLLASGMILSCSVEGFPANNTIALSPISDSIEMAFPFSGTNTTGLIVYSGILPPTTNYLKVEDLYNGSGFLVQNIYGNETGVYLTGTAMVYTDYGIADIAISLFDIANLSENELCYLKFNTNSNGIIPVSNNYYTSGVSDGLFSIRTKHLMPDSGVYATGLLRATFDKDHGYIKPSLKANFLQQIPLSFSANEQYILPGVSSIPPYTGNSPTNRIPKNGIFTVISVTGDYIRLNDGASYLIKESNTPSYFDIDQTGPYIRNTGTNSISVQFDKNYLQVNDQVYCKFPNDSIYNQNFRVLSTDSNTYSFRPVSGSISGLSNSGTVSYMGSTSGYVASTTNNIYFHSYGGRSESWGRDYLGRYVDPPLSGFFTTYNSSFLCNSGTLCIHISGISDFTTINREQSFYFDFIDIDSPILTGIFPIKDKINNSILTIDIPYNINYLNKSGLVYLIDSQENIKTNKNPNYNNVFTTSSLSINNNNSIFGSNFVGFNNFNNRWKHALQLKNTVAPSKYIQTLSVNRNAQSASKELRLIVVTPEDLSFTALYSTDTINYSAINNSISINTGDELRFKIITKNGAGQWSQVVNEAAPRINILGIENYQIIDNEKIYNTVLDQWEIIVRCGVINKTYTNKPIKITISDETTRLFKDFVITSTVPLTTTNIENTTYGYVGTGFNWRMFFEVYGGNLTDSQVPVVSLISQGYPDFSTSYSTVEYLNYPSGWYGVVVQGLPGSVTGVFNPVVSIWDGITTIQRTGTVIVRPGAGPVEPYRLSLRTFNNNILSKYSNTDAADFGFLLPAETNIGSNFNVSITNTGLLNVGIPIIEYRPNLYCYTYKVNISGSQGYYNPQVNVSIIQQSGGSPTQYARSTGINFTIYDDILLDSTELIQPLNFDINRDWSLDFNIRNGEVAYLSEKPPKVYISNTPNIGVYNSNDSNPLEYNIAYYYNNNNEYWKVSVTGKKDLFGNSAVSTGSYPLYIYAEDDTSYITGIININVTSSPYLANINTTKYATPNNGFEFNADVGAQDYGSLPPLTIPNQLKDALINPTRNYYSYDPNLNIWEAAYSCTALTEKWDASVSLIADNLSVTAKGILNDKLYVAGRVTTVETENIFGNISKPLNIKNLNSQYTVTQGNAWSISFKTEGGLEDSKYPPQIEFSNLPSACSGYDPRIPDASNNSCFSKKTWAPSNREWAYEFNGIPLCLAQGEFNVLVTAKDRIGENVYETDTATTKIVYSPLEDHPGPSIGGIDNRTLYPLCIPYQSNQAKYQINLRAKCPSPTGLSGIIVWGSLPSGLTLFDSMAGNYAPPYSNLSGGYISIQGNPLNFANGGQYAERLNVAVVDARGKSGVITNIAFTDGSSPIASSPTDITVYFANSGYYYTPVSGTGLITNENQSMLRPPAVPFSMSCLSVLPHSNCLYSTGLYSVIDANTIRLSGYGTIDSLPSNKNIFNNQRIYIEFDDQISSSFDKEYTVSRLNSSTISITSSGHGIDPSFSGLVKILKTENNRISTNINDAVYGGSPAVNPVDTTTTGLLGGGEFKTRNNLRGLAGRIKPSLIASLPENTGIYRTNSNHLEDFIINPIAGENNHISIIQFTNCYETGYLRVSGIILPTPVLESTDPPPGGGKNYSFNDQGAIAVAIRTSYGSTNEQRGLPENKRSLGINYSISNMINKAILSSGNISTDSQGTTAFTFNPPNISNGTVYRLYLQHLSNIEYPTYNKFAIPSLNNTYYWIHKAGADNAIPTTGSFPAIVPVEDKKLIFISGINPNTELSFVGGYIPNDSLLFPYGGWSYTNYSPRVTGYMQQSFVRSTGTYSQPQYSTNINLLINNNPFVSGDNILINFTSYPNYDNLPISSTGVILSSVSGNVAILNNVLPITYSAKSGTIEILDILKVVSGENPYQVKVFHRSGLSSEFGINKHVDLINIYDRSSSIQNNLVTNNYRLNVISGTNDYSYLAVNSFVFSGTVTSGSNTITNCSVNPLNILRTGVSLYSPTNILPTGHYVSGITSGTVSLTLPYTGSTANDVLIYFSGYDISGYYDNILGNNTTGLCEPRSNIYLSGNIPEFSLVQNSINANGQSKFNISGIPTSMGSYTYRIITCENPDLPVVTGSTLWNTKKYGKDYSLTTTTSPIIVAPSAIVSIVNNSWSYSFAVTGGYVPRKDRFLEIELNGLIHTFNRSENIVSDSGMLITLSSKAGFNWLDIFQLPVSLKVYDETGYDLTYINAVY